jgi:ribosomal protein S18 acetylase RimI-like enzyme
MASKGLASRLWRDMATSSQSPYEIGRARAMRETGDFSYRNAFIAELAGQPAGGLVGYPLADPYPAEALNSASAAFRPMVELEAEAAGHWYVNVLAVYPEHRGTGVGAALLDHAGRLGRASPKGMAIIVFSGNEGAQRLYARLGYRVAGRRNFSGPPGFKGGGELLLLTKPHTV